MKDLKIQVNWADFEVYPNCFELGDSIYDEANPKTSGLKKDLIYNEANPNLFVSSSPEPPNICAAGSSSSMQQKYPLKSDDTLTINICSADKIVPIIRSCFSYLLTFYKDFINDL